MSAAALRPAGMHVSDNWVVRFNNDKDAQAQDLAQELAIQLQVAVATRGHP
ncbi:hypothetical protein [Polaromonas jejuensis]|uniref:Uncharacterized protein n=1 Tax=Polaromonas jejuensis TaxID=457502 RepID=A0ABW0QB65_9BURK|nr:hypothetical protein [Polaromonas jejuensis]